MMHGEYKIPGGKLVVADLDVVNGCMCNVQLSGDFFLEPDTALAAMTAAVEGASAEADEAALAQRVRDAAGDAEMLGITPEGIVVALRRAVSGAAQ